MQVRCPEELLGPVLEESVEQLKQSVLELTSHSASSAEKLLRTWLLPVCAVSVYFARTAKRYPQSLSRLLESGTLQKGAQLPTPEQLGRELNLDLQIQQQNSSAGSDQNSVLLLQQHVLRVFRHRHMMRIVWSDLTQIYSLEQTLTALSNLAHACVVAADAWSHDALVLRFGRPVDGQGRNQRLMILGMGKLGGHELNVSSDIDLICLWPRAGNTEGLDSGSHSIDNQEFFRRLVQRLGKLLHSVTADGFVYRVDTRLRPFGESGPLVMNLDGLEHYLLTQARDWERYAMIKARALCGAAEDVQELEQLITPFVYRRYLDYNAFQALRDLKRKIALSVRQKSMTDNIKLGAGGIREIEFIGQAFQLVRGGRDTRLRIRPIMDVLTRLAEQKLMSVDEVQSLKAAYRFLRRVENAIQMIRDEQTHSLPSDPEDRVRLMAMMQISSWSEFDRTLADHQSLVSSIFDQLFESQAQDDEASEAWALLSNQSLDYAEKTSILRKVGFTADDSLLAAIDSISRSGFYQRLTSESQQRVERIMPLVLNHTKVSKAPEQTLHRVLALVRAVAGRSGYLQVLSEQPAALQRLVNLFSHSAWLANFVVKQPIVIDELLSTAVEDSGVDAAQVYAETEALVQRLIDLDLDEQMDALRHYRQAREMRLACAQIEGTLTLMQVSDQLSWLAESLIAAVMELVRLPLIKRHGAPKYIDDQGQIHSANVAVAAYGKLGGVELGFGSDLDLVFLHDSHGSKQETDGEKSVPNTVFYVRLAQKFVHFMSTATPAGILYEIDLRLRPNGSSGVLVTGIDSFASYQSGDAWVWEHQALIRARMVFGESALHQQFDNVRQQVLAVKRAPEKLREAVSSMRKRMRESLGSNDATMMHLKQDAGGVADLEFIVQFLVLAHAHDYPELLQYTDNIRILNCVAQLGLLPEEHCRLLQDSYLALRERLHRCSLSEASAVVPLDAELAALAAGVEGLRDEVLVS